MNITEGSKVFHYESPKQFLSFCKTLGKALFEVKLVIVKAQLNHLTSCTHSLFSPAHFLSCCFPIHCPVQPLCDLPDD